MKYRPEIDGLRAIAVTPVILFHAGLPGFAGGYVGVDVFFVISGYLITSLILADLDAGKFSFAQFYERRARRILPALLCVMLVSIPLAWAWMLPSQFKDFSGSLFSIGVFLSNFYFLTQVEYFQPASELQPMLHSWSLSIEEQYYLIFPALAVLLIKLSRIVLFGFILLSVLGGIWLSHLGITDDPGKNYFHTATRLWEIGAGALCAFAPRWRVPGLDGLGLVLIFYSVVVFDHTTPFPSLYTLVPIVGTMLVILSTNAAKGLGKLLAAPVLVGIGLVSYSAYLWHQPLFAFARLRSLHEPGPVLMLGLIGVTFLAAYLSWRFVEMPFRKAPNRKLNSRFMYVTLSLGITFSVTGLGLWGYLQAGFPSQTVKREFLTSLDQRLEQNPGLDAACLDGFTFAAECRTSDAPNTLLWGDSYAMHLAQGLVSANPEVKLQQQTLAGCAPLPGLSFTAKGLGHDVSLPCFDFNDRVLQFIRDHETIKTIVMSSPFPIYRKTLWDRDGEPVPLEAIERSLSATFQQLRDFGLHVILVSPPPMSGEDLGQCAAKALRYLRDEASCDFPRDHLVNGEIFKMLDRLSGQVEVIRLDDVICDEETCDTIRDGQLIYRDDGHLSMEGSKLVGLKALTL